MAGGCQAVPAIAGYLASKAADKVIETVSVQNSCAVVAWGAGLPSIQGYVAKLSLKDQLLVQTATQAATDCANGNAPQAIGDIASGLVTILYSAH